MTRTCSTLLAVAALVVLPAPDHLLLGTGYARALANGGPRVELNHLELPPTVKQYERFLRRVLAREAHKVDWGAGAGSTIQYRFFVDELRVTVKDNALVVRCAAIGRLPRGRSAKSQLSFGGELGKKRQLIERVLTIVARGVLTRLSELERERREG